MFENHVAKRFTQGWNPPVPRILTPRYPLVLLEILFFGKGFKSNWVQKLPTRKQTLTTSLDGRNPVPFLLCYVFLTFFSHAAGFLTIIFPGCFPPNQDTAVGCHSVDMELSEAQPLVPFRSLCGLIPKLPLLSSLTGSKMGDLERSA